MSAVAEKTVRDLALENTSATRVFEKLGIDYCCGGDKSLEDACRAANLSVEQVQDALDTAQRESASTAVRDWQREPPSELVAHINATHHNFVRQETARLGPRFDKVCGVHEKNHPELLHIQAVFRGLAQELIQHLMKEEMVLFPYIVPRKSCDSGGASSSAGFRNRRESGYNDGAGTRQRRTSSAGHSCCQQRLRRG